MRVPEVVRSKAVAAGAAHWLDELPGLVARLAGEWAFRVVRPLSGGTESLVLDVVLGDGTPAVLKLMIPRPADAVDAAANEICFLLLAGGEGCARLLADDEEAGALLLERLGRPLHELAFPIAQRQEILCAAASRVWRPAPGCALPTGAAKGRWLVDFITATWEELGRPCSERAVDEALGCAERRIARHDGERAVLVHGDVHAANALESGDGFKLIDPDGLLAEAEYDMGILMREDPVELMRGDPWERARRLAAWTDLDPVAVWEWGAVERVSTGLLCTQVDFQPLGRQMLQAADHVASLSGGADPV